MYYLYCTASETAAAVEAANLKALTADEFEHPGEQVSYLLKPILIS